MKKQNMKIAVLLLCFVFTAVSVSAQTDQVDEVLKLVSEYDTAFKSKDSKTVRRIMSDNYVYFTSKGGTSNFQESIDFLVSPEFRLTESKRSEIKAYRTGDAVLVSSRWTARGRYKNGEIDDDQRCSLVFVNFDGCWKLISEHCSNIPAK